MTPLDYGQNLAQSVGIPGINLNQATSAMSQLVFQNGGARNLGSNGNQPLITNQNDYQIFNNVTRVAGRHTMKFGGSLTMRSREVLNADLIVGQFGFHQNDTSSCAGITVGCTPLANTGFDVASFALGYAAIKDRRLFDAETYTETRPEIAIYVQDDMRIGDRLTLNAGLRWDLFVPWVEVDDRQSNFDESTGRFVVASPDAVVNGVKVGRYLQTYSKKDFGPRFGAAYDLFGDGRTIIRGGYGIFWNMSTGGTSSSKAQNPPFLQSTTLTTTFGNNLRLQDGMPPPPGVDPNREPAGTTRSVFDVDFRDAYAHNFNVNVQRQLGSLYMMEVAYAGSRGRNLPLKADPNQPLATLGVTDNNVNRPYIRVSPQLRTVGQLRSEGFVDYNGLLVKFQRRYANNFSTMTSYTFAKSEDYNSDNDGTVTLAERLQPGVRPGPGAVRRHAHVQLHRDLRAAVGERKDLWRLAGERRRLSPVRSAGQHHDDTERLVDDGRHRGAPEPDLQRAALGSDHRPLVRYVLLRQRHREHGDLRQRAAQLDSWTRPGQLRRVDDQEHAHRPVRHRVPDRGLQPVQPRAVRAAERAARQPDLRRDQRHARQPVVRLLRHDRAAGADCGQDQVLIFGIA